MAVALTITGSNMSLQNGLWVADAVNGDGSLPAPTTLTCICASTAATLGVVDALVGIDSFQVTYKLLGATIRTDIYTEADKRTILQAQATIDEMIITFTHVAGTSLQVYAPMIYTLADEAHVAYDASFRRVTARAAITFLDPFIDYVMNVTSDDNWFDSFGTTPQVIDGVLTPLHAWFSFTNNKLDGSYHPLESSNMGVQVGWWSSELSDAGGQLLGLPQITVTMTGQPALAVVVAGDGKAGVFPVDFDIKLYNGTTLLDTLLVRDNTEISYIRKLLYTNVTKFDVVFRRMNRPNDRLRIMEVGTKVKIEYDDTRIIDLSILEEVTYEDSQSTLGLISSNECSLTLDNLDREITLEDPDSPYYQLLTRNRLISVDLAVEDATGQLKWSPMGRYYSTANWVVDEERGTVTCRGLDILEVLRMSSPWSSPVVYVNKTLAELFAIVLNAHPQLDLVYNIDPSLSSIVIPFAWFSRVTFREALKQLSMLAKIVVYTDRLGVIQVRPVDAYVDEAYRFSDDRSLIGRRYPNRWHTEVNKMQALVKSYSMIAGNFTSTSLATVSIPANTTMHGLQVPVPSAQVPSTVTNITTATAGLVLSNKVYTVDGITFSVQNTTGGALNLGTLTVTATKLNLDREQLVSYEVAELIQSNGLISLPTMDVPMLQDPTRILSLLTSLVTEFTQRRMDIEMTARGNALVDLMSQVQVEDSVSKVPRNYGVQRIQTTWNGALGMELLAKKL